MKRLIGLWSLVVVTTCAPASTPGFATTQYLTGSPGSPPFQLSINKAYSTYTPQPQYLGQSQPPQAGPSYEGQQKNFLPQRQYNQVLLPSNADQQIQRAAAQIAGPAYAQQVQALQYQELANQAQTVAQRRAQAALRQAQIQKNYLQQQQPQYIQEVTPAAQNTRPLYHVPPRPQQHQQQQFEPQYQQRAQHQQRQQQPEESQEEQQQPSDDYDPNPSYQFGFDVKDDYYTNYQNRKEQREGNKISGSYSVVDSDGFIRTVTYTADPKEGFKAEVQRQPTDIVVKIPKPVLPPPKHQHAQQQYIEDVPDQRAQLQGQKQKLIYQYQ